MLGYIFGIGISVGRQNGKKRGGERWQAMILQRTNNEVTKRGREGKDGLKFG